MAAKRTLAVVAAVLLTASTASAQTYTLTEEVKSGDCFQVRMKMSLSGEMRVSRDGKQVPLKQSAAADHEFLERILDVDKTGLPDKSARRYTKATASIVVGNDRTQHALDTDRGLLVCQRVKDQIISYCPTSALTRGEIEVLEHLDTLALTGLLPGKTVKVGETWKLPNAVVQALCHFEGLTDQDLKGELMLGKNETLKIVVKGTASGIELGAMVKLTIDATAHFDLKTKRLISLDWKEKDEREQGPASPASTVEVTTTLDRAIIDTPESLTDVALVSVPSGDAEPPAEKMQVALTDAKGRFDLTHSRDWTLVGQTDEHVILRLMDRGDFVAQVTITPWESADKGKHMDPDKFRELMARTPGWDMEKELQTGEVPSEGGRWVYRVSAQGQLEGANVMQSFYLIAGPNGDQVVLVFTMTPKQSERLGTRDLSLAGSIDFPKKK
jgi:hypothetical protein